MEEELFKHNIIQYYSILPVPGLSNIFLTDNKTVPDSFPIHYTTILDLLLPYNKVILPVPGGPVKRIPLGSFPPNLVNLLLSLKYITISSSSALASSTPTTSANDLSLVRKREIKCVLVVNCVGEGKSVCK